MELFSQEWWLWRGRDKAAGAMDPIPAVKAEAKVQAMAAPEAEKPWTEPVTDYRDYIDQDIWDAFMGHCNPEGPGTLDKVKVFNIASGTLNTMMMMTIGRRLHKVASDLVSVLESRPAPPARYRIEP